MKPSDPSNPQDCHCGYVHCSDPSCRSKQVSRGAVEESDRYYPAIQSLDYKEKAQRFLSYYSEELGEDQELVACLADLLQREPPHQIVPMDCGHPFDCRSDKDSECSWCASLKELREALQGIIEIGKRDMTNPKYDPYFDYARAVLKV